METVQLQCGSCRKLMAISTQHLGGQVRCPHCQAVVQAPPRPQSQPQQATVPAPAPPPEILPPHVEPGEMESIFSPAEPSEDLFDAGPPRALVEMPPDPGPVPALESSVTVEAQTPPYQEGIEAGAPPFGAAPVALHALDGDGTAAHHDEAPAADGQTAEAHADLASFQRPQVRRDKGYGTLMLLIFLVPYSIMMTLFVAYLWYQLAQERSGLEMLPDPVPKKDGPRTVLRAAHDQPLADRQKVRLNETKRIGEIEVTPEKVVRDSLGDLELTLRVRNVSTNQAFSPLHPDFLKTGNSKAMPYTFLESKQFVRLYGGHLAFIRGEEMTSEGDLQPGQAESVVITTRDNKAVVEKIVQSDENLMWRVQLRRGLVQRISATTVVGVVFNAKDIGKGG